MMVSSRLGYRWVLGAAATALLSSLAVAPAHAADPAVAGQVVVDVQRRYQKIDGFGISQAFGTANQVRYLGDTPVRQQALDLLFDRTNGAGFSILRNLIPSDASPNHSIVQTAPANPSETPTYVFDPHSDFTDWGQLWLTREALKRGPVTVYADAWSAPGYMKTNNSESNGGMLCGTPGATCASGDWRQAYADYLVRYVKFYEEAGITVPYLGFVNEPSYTVGYSSMLVNAAQAVDVAKILGPTVRKAGLPSAITCCDTIGWKHLPDYTRAVLADQRAKNSIGVFTGHGYAAPADSAVDSGGKRVWQTEWSHGSGTWNAAWDDGSSTSGFSWALNIHNGMTAANLNAFLYWWGVSTNATSNSNLIRLDGTTLRPAKRYYAFVNYSRFIRPGAVRLGATSADDALKVSAYRNAEGPMVVVALNTATTDKTFSYTLSGVGVRRGSVTPYVTNQGNDTAAQPPVPMRDGAFTATVPARSLVTYVVNG